MLKIMTMNINYYVTKHGPWERRRELIAKIIEENSPDLIALQAVRSDPAVEAGRDQANQLASLFPEYGHIYFQTAARLPGDISEGSAIVSRLPFAECGSLPLTTLPGLDDTAQRVVLHARFDLPGGPFYLFNAHFSWVAEQGARNVSETLPYLEMFYGPALLVGDLNAPAPSTVLAPFPQAGWVDAWERLHPEEAGYTFESDVPSIRIDYAWANAALAPYLDSVEIAANRQIPNLRPSDHLALLLTLSLPA